VLSFGSEPAAVNAPYPTVIGRFNDVDGATAMITETDDLAAVLVEPMMGSGRRIPASAELLEALRTATSDRGTVLVFDEVMTSRAAPGGAQELYGVLPDLTTLGKYVGGGMSFGAFGGTRALMDQFDPTLPGALAHAGTFNNNVLTMAAGSAALSKVFTPEAARALAVRGDHVRDTLNARFGELGSDWQCTGLGSIMNLHPSRATVGHPGDLAAADDRRRELLFLDLLEEGYYIARRGFIALSLALSNDDLDGFVAAVSQAVTRRG
jgi:glutamate-1-semialdehyde 2,1-aminomutase